MKRASEYRRMARISMAGQLGTMAASGVMEGLAVIAVVLVLGLFLMFGLAGAGFAAFAGGFYNGLARAGLVLWIILVALMIFAAAILDCLLNGGIIYQARKVTRGQEISIRDLGYGLKLHIAWKILVVELVTFLIMLFFDIPYYGAVTFGPLLLTGNTGGLAMFLLQCLIGCLVIVWMWIGRMVVFLFLGLSVYVLIDCPHLGPLQCMRESIRLTRGHRRQFFCLYLSFIGWWILGTMSGGIGLLWITPYFFCTVYHFYEDLKAGL